MNVEAIKELANQMGVSADWSSTNILPYLQDLTTRYANYIYQINLVILIASVIAIVLILLGLLISYIKEGEFLGEIVAITVILSIIPIISIILSTRYMIKAKTIPEMLIIEKISGER